MSTERKKILVPVDFEGASKRAIEAAKWLAGALGAELVLLHVHDRPGFDHPELPGDMVSRIEGLVEQAAQKSLADLAKEVGAKQTVFRHGDPAERILEVTKEIAPEMIVMGTHGRRGINRFFMGSIATQVVRAAPVPVVTVRALPEDAG
jgi:nucleotide-binding universal stress UspA family protein